MPGCYTHQKFAQKSALCRCLPAYCAGPAKSEAPHPHVPEPRGVSPSVKVEPHAPQDPAAADGLSLATSRCVLTDLPAPVRKFCQICPCASARSASHGPVCSAQSYLQEYSRFALSRCSFIRCVTSGKLCKALLGSLPDLPDSFCWSCGLRRNLFARDLKLI